uniref:C2H2-type domain-containing protein n=1 Tax=Glossina brevipalpis TaxID=37001 RepID=A0A1A9WQB1_9MUSC
MSTFDGEICEGKIVCSIDGSSFVINAENEIISSISDSSISVAAPPITNTTTSALATETSLSSCFTLAKTWTTPSSTVENTRSAPISSTIYRRQSKQQQQRTVTEANVNPKIHTFRVIFANDAKLQQRNEKTATTATHFKIQKPILMCFICKLSFGITKSFSLHASIEHGLNLQELEKYLLLQREYSSAIIQRNMDEKPQISFLEPIDAATSNLLQIESQTPVNVSRGMTIIDREEDTTLKFKTFADIVGNDDSDDVNNKTTNTFASLNQFSDPAKISLSTAPAAIVTTTVDASQSHSDKESSTQLPSHQQHLKYFYDDSTTDVCSILTNSNILTLGSSNLENLPSMNTNANTTAKIDVASNNSSRSSFNRFIIAAACTKSSLTVKRALETTMDSSLRLHNLPTPDSLIQRIQKISIASERRILTSPQQADSNDIHIDGSAKTNTLAANWSQLSTPHSFSTPAVAVTSSVVSTPPPESSHFHSLQASLATVNSEKNSNKVKFLNEFLQHQLNTMHLQQQSLPQLINNFSDKSVGTLSTTSPPTSMLTVNACPQHADCKGIDCKTCELLEIQQNFKLSPQVTPQRSPTGPNIATAAAAAAAAAASLGLLSAANTISPTSNTGVNSGILTGNLNTSNMINAGPGITSTTNAASFTIGACSEHINGRPLGVDCARCEMILSSARLSSNIPISTRNSCKTLKCPQCNWHYKYQETLEIHMREKHPDGESACGYCLAGQQHPRLARGESYSCGYKPYRCEICNYSTTTKGNLSIHMQSDKHLNNMQELNSSQNMVAAAVAAAGGVATVTGNLETTSKLNLTNNTPINSHQQHQQQQSMTINSSKCSNSAPFTGSSTISAGTSNNTGPSGANSLNSNIGNGGSNSGGVSKTKPSFRCDICSYETSVARNLRIHMTSEKHTHNMAVLQNNIKHIQAFNFLQHQQQQQQHQGSCFIPEIALADLAYNQALMIQFLHQNATIAASQCRGSLVPSSALPTASKGSLQNVSNNHTATSCKPQELSPIVNELQQPPFSPKAPCIELGSSDGSMTMESPPYIPDPWPTMLYSCLVCSNFNTNNLDELNQHLLIDRSRQPLTSGQSSNSVTSTTDSYASQSPTYNPTISSSSSGSSLAITTVSVNVPSANTGIFSDVMLIQNNNYICRLCNYKTNLKANFQLHSKTDKHLQKLSFINHVREGGKRNEQKLKFYQQQQQQIGSSAVQIKCNCCDFYTNSIQKLSLHTQHMRHDTMLLIFKHLNSLIYDQPEQQQQQERKQQEQRVCSRSNSRENESHKSPSPALKTTSTMTTAAASSLPTDSVITQNVLHCQVCNFSALSLLEMLQHAQRTARKAQLR